jgi:hypothetical protein
VVVLAQSVGEALRDGRVVTFLPEADDDHFVSLGTAHEHEVAVAQIADEDGPPRARLDAPRGVGLGNARRDFGQLIERTPNPLPVPLDRMMCYDDDQASNWSLR